MDNYFYNYSYSGNREGWILEFKMRKPENTDKECLGFAKESYYVLGVISSFYNNNNHNLFLGKTFSQLRDFQKGPKH